MVPGEKFMRGDVCYAIESHLRGDALDIDLVHYVRQPTGLWHKSWHPVETIATRRFSAQDMVGYWHYAAKLEEAARHALDGELGAYVEIRSIQDGLVRIRLVDRQIRGPDLITEIREEHVFDASAWDTTVASAELAAELRERARALNDAASTARALELSASAAERAAEAAGVQERQHDAEDLAQILREQRG